MKNSVDVKLPYLVNGKRAVFVEYKVLNPATGKLTSYRHYKGFAKCESPQEVHDHAAKIIEHLRKKLKAGWRPWSESEFIFKDELEMQSIAAIMGRRKRSESHLRKCINEYLVYKKPQLKQKSYVSYVSKLRTFTMWMEREGFVKIRVGEISSDIINKFFIYLISERKLDKRTVDKYRHHLHNLYTFLKREKLVHDIPLTHVPRALKKVDMAARPMTDRDMALYIDYVSSEDPQLLLASLFQLLLLCRPNQELRLMKIYDIDLKKQIARISDQNAKMRARVVTMPTALVEIAAKFNLEKYPGDYYIFGQGGKPGPDVVGVNYFNRKFSKYKKYLGLPDTYKFYSFKHTGAGKLLESGATLAELMSHLGHTKFESTIHYVRRHFGEKSEKILNFRPDFLNGIKV